MPSYISNPQSTQIVALYPGIPLTLVNNAASETGITTTLQFAFGYDAAGGSELTISNTTNETATMETSPFDIAADYQPYSIDGTAVTIASDTAIQVPVNARWVRFTFGTAPTSGSLVVSR